MAIDNESFELLLSCVQRFVRERLVPAEDAVEEHDEVPADIMADMKEMGLFGLSIPEDYGGIGLSMRQECRVAYEVGQTARAFRSVFGTTQRILEESVAYARERKQFGKRIGEFQVVQAMLADSQAELYAGWSMVRDCAQRYDAKPSISASDPDVSMRASCCKLYCTEMAGRVADRGVQVHGGSGYINEYPVERFYRDVRLLRLYEGTTQIQQLIIGRELIGRE